MSQTAFHARLVAHQPAAVDYASKSPRLLFLLNFTAWLTIVSARALPIPRQVGEGEKCPDTFEYFHLLGPDNTLQWTSYKHLLTCLVVSFIYLHLGNMVTGVEAAGLVMAAFPLVVSALQSYLEGLESIRHWWRYAKLLKHFIRILDTERTKFENVCEEHLYEAFGGSELSRLLEDPGGPRWSQPSLLEKLRNLLGRSFQPYLDAAMDTREILQAFEKKLELDELGKVSFITLLASSPLKSLTRMPTS